ncbi:MAG: hypothetical protein OEY41_00730 [Acidimicrobiia bacterium]|nr:hypothetical protein [Acidimicrobiia bacterium]
MEGSGLGPTAERSSRNDAVRAEDAVSMADQMAAALHRLVSAPDTAAAADVIASFPPIRQPAALALLDARARRAAANGGERLARRLSNRVELLAGTTAAGPLQVLVDLGHAERALLSPSATGRPAPEDVERARQSVTSLMAASPDSYPRPLWPPVWDTVARLSTRLAELNENPVWIEVAVSATRRAVELAPADGPELARQLNNLSVRLARLHAASGDDAVLEEAHATAQRAVDLTDQASPELAGRLGNLANRLAELYHTGAGRAALDEAVSVARQAVAAAAPQAAELPALLDNLSAHLLASFDVGGPRVRLDEAVSVARRAAQLTPRGTPAHVARLDGLALRLTAQGTAKGDEQALAEGIEASRQALQMAPSDSVWWVGLTLALALVRRAQAASDRAAALDGAEATLTTLGALPPPAPRGRPGPLTGEHTDRLAALAVTLGQLYARFGEARLAEAAVAAARAALAHTPVTSPARSARTSELAALLSSTHPGGDERAALTEAVALCRSLVDQTPVDVPHRWLYHEQLAHHLGELHRLDADPDTITAAVAEARRALEVSQLAGRAAAARPARSGSAGVANEATNRPGVPTEADRTRLVHALSLLLARQYGATRRPAVLEEALVTAREAAAATPAEGVERARRYHDLSARLLEQYGLNPDTVVLEEAAAAGRTAVESARADDPARAAYLNNLANALARLHVTTGSWMCSTRRCRWPGRRSRPALAGRRCWPAGCPSWRPASRSCTGPPAPAPPLTKRWRRRAGRWPPPPTGGPTSTAVSATWPTGSWSWRPPSPAPRYWPKR